MTLNFRGRPTPPSSPVIPPAVSKAMTEQPPLGSSAVQPLDQILGQPTAPPPPSEPPLAFDRNFDDLLPDLPDIANTGQFPAYVEPDRRTTSSCRSRR